MGSKKPFRVWNVGRDIKKSLVAASLTELKQKGCQKLSIEQNNTTVTLEEDGTIVDDPEYFDLCEPNTTFVFVAAGQKWRPVWEKGEDEVDGEVSPLERVTAALRRDLAALVTLATDDLQLLVDTDTEHLASLLGNHKSEAKSIQDSCQRYVDERLEAAEAVLLVKTLARAKDQQQDADAGPAPPKRSRQL